MQNARDDDLGSFLHLGALYAVPFAALMVFVQTTDTGNAAYFVRSLAVWMGFVTLLGCAYRALKPHSRTGWSRVWAFFACGAVKGLWSAQSVPLSLGSASPVEFGATVTLGWMLGLGAILAWTKIDPADPPKLPSFQEHGSAVSETAEVKSA